MIAERADDPRARPRPGKPRPSVIPFTLLEEISKAVRGAFRCGIWEAMARKAGTRMVSLHRARGPSVTKPKAQLRGTV